MNAKQFAYIMSRLFAVYLIYNIVPQLIYLGASVPFLLGFGSGENMGWLSWAMNLSLQMFFLFLVYIFWVKAAWFANRISDPLCKGTDEPEPNLPWEVLGIAIVGGFALKNGLTELILFASNILTQTSSSSYGISELNFKEVDYSHLAYAVGDLILAFVFLLTPKRLLLLISKLRKLDVSNLVRGQTQDRID